MTQATDTLEVAIINHFFRGVSQTATSGWVALYNGNPTDTAAAGTDVTTTVRPAGRVAAGFAAPTSGAGTASNAATIDFGSTTADVTITHFAVFDAASGGNMLTYGALLDANLNAVTRTLLAGDGLTFPAGTLIVTVA